MKFIILLASLFIFNYANSQTFTKKDFNEDQYLMTDSVLIETGHNEKVNVYFVATIPKDKWQQFLIKNNTNDTTGFSIMAAMVSNKARYKLFNPASFVPFKNQTIGWRKGFDCYYGMMGRNGYGTLIETGVWVTCKTP